MRYNRSLDGLRAFAVAITMAAHLGFRYPVSGMVGVDIFFVLSGFLITSILSEEVERTGQIGIRNFYIRRALRLFPCLVLTCLVCAVWTVVNKNFFPSREILIALTYTSNWARAVFRIDLPSLFATWSLASEEQYYLLWPWLVLLLERAIGSRGIKAVVLFFLAVALAVYRAKMVGVYSSGRIVFGLDTHMDGLVLGSALGYFVRWQRGHGGGLPYVYRGLSYFVVPVAVGVLVVIMNVVSWLHPWMGRIGFFLVAVCSALIIADLVLSPYSLLKRVFSCSGLVYVGKISYGLYLLHGVVFDIVRHLGRGLPSAPLSLIKVLSTFIIAMLSYHFWEIYFLRMKGRFSRGASS